MKPSILVIGSEGLVGSRFVEISAHRSDFHAPKLVEFDFTNKSEVKAVLASYNFRAVINFAAFTDVNAAENERGNREGNCWQINVEGPRNLSEAIKSLDKKTLLIHISTDMVFSGDKKDKGPYEEKHEPEKNLERVTWYGYTKGEGEKVIREILGADAAIVRIIYPVRAKFDAKPDYLRKPLSLYDQGKLYPMFSDQQISIAFIDEIGLALDKIVKDRVSGTFHVSSRDTTYPYELVSYMLEKTRGIKNAVVGSKLDGFLKNTKSASYRYPKYGGLKVEETEKSLGLKFSTWKEIVDKLVAQGLGK